MNDLVINHEVINGLRDIDPNEFSYSQMKKVAKSHGIPLDEISAAINKSSTTMRKDAKANNNIMGSQYFYILIGLIAIRKQANLEITEE